MPAPGARTRARGVDEDEIHPPHEVLQGIGAKGGADLEVADPCPLSPADGICQAPGVGIVGVDLAGGSHGGGQGQGLSPAACAEVEDLGARNVAGAGRSDLGAGVLDLHPALDELRQALDRRRAFGGGGRIDPQGKRQAGDGMGAKGLGRPQRPGRIALQGVDPQVDRRAAGQGLRLGPDAVAEDPFEGRGEPVRQVGGHRIGSSGEVARFGDTGGFRGAQRARSMRCLSKGGRDPVGRPVPVQGQHPQDCPAPSARLPTGAGAGRPGQGRQRRRGHPNPRNGPYRSRP